MFIKEWLPYALSIGVSYNDFWHMNPRILNAIGKGYNLKRKARDEEMWLQGLYNYRATATAISNCFSEKSKAQYIQSPLLSDYAAKDEISEEERIQQENYKLAMTLRIGQANFELSKKRKLRDGMGS